MREGTLRSRALTRAHCRDVLQQHRQRQLARAIVDLQRADAGRQVDDAIDILRLQVHEGVRPEARDEVQFGRAHFEQQMGVARQAGPQALVAGARVEHDRRGRGRGLPVLLVRGQRRAFLVARAARRRAVGRSTAMNCTRSPALSWPSCHRSASMTVTGHTKPPRDHRVPGSPACPREIRPPRHTGCRGCWKDAGPLPAAVAGPFGPGTDQPDARAAGLKCTSHWAAKKVSMYPAVKYSGAPWGP